MKVAELILMLQSCNQDAVVGIQVGDGSVVQIEQVVTYGKDIPDCVFLVGAEQ